MRVSVELVPGTVDAVVGSELVGIESYKLLETKMFCGAKKGKKGKGSEQGRAVTLAAEPMKATPGTRHQLPDVH